MTRIADLLAAQRTLSFEFFPPKTEQAEAELHATLGELEPLEPHFVSVTYGAGGSTRDRTRDIVVGIERDRSFAAMAHLTCLGHTTADIDDLLDSYLAAGVQNILALGGDPPKDGPAPEGDFRYACDLVEHLRSRGEFSVGVAAHPEGHPRSPDLATDRRHLARKLETADFAITQFFFRAEDYLRLVDELADLGCAKPVVPGIMPVTNAGQVKRFAELAGADFPAELGARIESVAHDPAEVRRIGVEVATELCATLLDAGIPGLHFYTLNRSTATREIATNLGLTANRRL
jgi:methylenetetrahydrofolate reductase (NADPH)